MKTVMHNTSKMLALLLAMVLAVGAMSGMQVQARDAGRADGGRAVISAGNTHSMAIMADGSMLAWGGNSYGQIGDGTRNQYEAIILFESASSWMYELVVDNNRYTPVRHAGNIIAVSASSHTMAIRQDGSLWAWGSNISGQLDDGAYSTWEDRSNDRIRPARIMQNVVSVSAGERHTLAVLSDGSLLAWGEGATIHPGVDTVGRNTRPARVMEDVVVASAGEAHSLAIRSDGSLWAWGSNWDGQLGDGSDRLYRNQPVRIMVNVVAVSAGANHSMAIQADGSLWAWGYNEFGQIGDGSRNQREFVRGSEVDGWREYRLTEDNNRRLPVRIMENVVAVSAGAQHSMAIRTDGSLWAWGANETGILGDGTTICRLRPVQIMENVVAVSAGNSHNLAVQSDGSLWAWGWNWFGQLGDGARFDQHRPIRVMENVRLPGQ